MQSLQPKFIFSTSNPCQTICFFVSLNLVVIVFGSSKPSIILHISSYNLLGMQKSVLRIVKGAIIDICVYVLQLRYNGLFTTLMFTHIYLNLCITASARCCSTYGLNTRSKGMQLSLRISQIDKGVCWK